jgi:periplasmic divalent cation tolerance protein
MNAPVLIVQTTVASTADAEKLAQALIERRLAACVQMSGITSVYRWAGEVQSGHEIRLDIKTSGARKDALLQGLKELHPYQVPELLVIDVDAAGVGYAKWVAEETAIEQAG